MFAELGVPIIDTDIIARQIVQPGEPALDEIRARFGDAVIAAGGELDRAALRTLIFSGADARMDLEAILHPRIGTETYRQSEVASGPYHLIVVPLLVGSQLLQFVDRVLLVDCDEDTQIQRLLARDTETVEQARNILLAQASRESRLAIADDIIHNEHSVGAARQRVTALHQRYRQLAHDSYRREQSPETP